MSREEYIKNSRNEIYKYILNLKKESKEKFNLKRNVKENGYMIDIISYTDNVGIIFVPFDENYLNQRKNNLKEISNNSEIIFIFENEWSRHKSAVKNILDFYFKPLTEDDIDIKEDKYVEFYKVKEILAERAKNYHYKWNPMDYTVNFENMRHFKIIYCNPITNKDEVVAIISLRILPDKTAYGQYTYGSNYLHLDNLHRFLYMVYDYCDLKQINFYLSRNYFLWDNDRTDFNIINPQVFYLNKGSTYPTIYRSRVVKGFNKIYDAGTLCITIKN